MGKRRGPRDIYAEITEVFPSIQGEGIFVGQPQVFIRFAKCNLSCDYCDTTKDGGKPYGVYNLLNCVNKINGLDRIDTVSITGGEPLLYSDFLKQFLPQLKKRNFKVYLETNGTLPAELKKVLGLVDTIAMDIKMPSSQRGRNLWKSHKDFLRAANKKNVFVKAVVTDRTSAEEIKKTVAIIKAISTRIPFVIQPVTPVNRTTKKISPGRLLEFQALAKSVLNDVRIVPQIHKALGVR